LQYYENKEHEKALEVLDRFIGRGEETTSARVTRCYVLLEMANGPERAREALGDIRPPPGPMGLFPQTVFRLLGCKAEAEAATRAIREHILAFPGERRRWLELVVDYNTGKLDADKLLREAGPSRLARCEAHFFIGLTCLADRKRQQAKNHFDEV